jgi:hypothetical protein
MCSKNNGAMAKNTAILQEKEVTDRYINDLSAKILTAFCYILNKAEDADKDVYDKMMARRSQELIDDITEIIEDRR